MIEYFFLSGIIASAMGFIGWLVGYAMGSKDYEENKEFIENG